MIPFIASAFAATLAGVALAPTLTVDEHRLELASCGVRDTLWIDHYVAALYVPAGSSPQVASDPSQAKAVQLKIVEARYLPERIPEKWRHALQGELSREPMVDVRRAYGALSDGDVVVIAYVPGQGVSMRVNDRLVMRAPGHGTIDAILAAWAEDDPVSGKLQRLRLEHPC